MNPPGRTAAAAVLVATDLDRTLIYSASALGLDAAGIADTDAPPMSVAEVYRGAPISYLTVRGGADLALAAERGALVVPTTTRTRAQYARVRLPGLAPEYAITTNGAHLLRHGVAQEWWTTRVRGVLAREAAPLAEVEAHLHEVASPTFVARQLAAEDVFAYLVVVREAVPDGWLAELSDWCARIGWRVSLQGRKVYAVPVALTKSAAVAEVAERTGAQRVVAGGDSLLDAELLDAADAAVRPAHGELHATGFERPHLSVTARAGVLGGEDVAAWYLAQVT